MPRFQTGRGPCGFPDNLVIVMLDQYIISIYGHKELIHTLL